MTQTPVSTIRFGDIQVENDRIVHFVEPVFGFEKSTRYVILDHSENSPFKWLQSVDEGDLAFVVTNPAFFGIEYEFEVPDDTASKLALASPDDVLVLTIVNIPQSDPSKMTANLLGPVIINQANRKALQVVLSESRYDTKTRLISPAAAAAEQGATAKNKGAAAKNKGE